MTSSVSLVGILTTYQFSNNNSMSNKSSVIRKIFLNDDINNILIYTRRCFRKECAFTTWTKTSLVFTDTQAGLFFLYRYPPSRKPCRYEWTGWLQTCFGVTSIDGTVNFYRKETCCKVPFSKILQHKSMLALNLQSHFYYPAFYRTELRCKHDIEFMSINLLLRQLFCGWLGQTVLLCSIAYTSQMLCYGHI